jgi:hypothetical protein
MHAKAQLDLMVSLLVGPNLLVSIRTCVAVSKKLFALLRPILNADTVSQHPHPHATSVISPLPSPHHQDYKEALLKKKTNHRRSRVAAGER